MADGSLKQPPHVGSGLILPSPIALPFQKHHFGKIKKLRPLDVGSTSRPGRSRDPSPMGVWPGSVVVTPRRTPAPLARRVELRRRKETPKAEHKLSYVKIKELRALAESQAFFLQVPPSLREALLKRMLLVSYVADSFVFQRGDADQALYIVLAGSLAVFSGGGGGGGHDDDDAATTPLGQYVCTLRRGDSVGARSLLVERASRPMDAVCLEDTALAVLSRGEYLRAVCQYQLRHRGRVLRPPNPGTFTFGLAQDSDESLPVPWSWDTDRVRAITARRARERTQAETDELRCLLQYNTLFKVHLQLSTPVERNLCSALHYEVVRPGQLIYHQNERVTPDDSVYIIARGSVSQHCLSDADAEDLAMLVRQRRGNRHDNHTGRFSSDDDDDEEKKAASVEQQRLEAYGPCKALFASGDVFGDDEFDKARPTILDVPRSPSAASARSNRERQGGEEEEEGDGMMDSPDITISKKGVLHERRATTVIAREVTHVVRFRYRHLYAMMKQQAHREMLRDYDRVRSVLKDDPWMRDPGMIHSVAHATRHLKFFKNQPKHVVENLCKVMRCRSFRAGHIVCRQGEPGDLFYVVLSGSAEVYVQPKDQTLLHGAASSERAPWDTSDDDDDDDDHNDDVDEDSNILTRRRQRKRLKQQVQSIEDMDPAMVSTLFGRCVVVLGEGASFGEQAVIENKPRGATVICREPTELLCVTRRDYVSVLGHSAIYTIDNVDKIATLLSKPVEERTNQDLEFLLDNLKGVAFFHDMPLSVRRFVVLNMHFESTERDTVIYEEGDRAEHLFIILRGSCSVHKRRPEPRRVHHHHHDHLALSPSKKSQSLLQQQQQRGRRLSVSVNAAAAAAAAATAAAVQAAPFNPRTASPRRRRRSASPSGAQTPEPKGAEGGRRSRHRRSVAHTHDELTTPDNDEFGLFGDMKNHSPRTAAAAAAAAVAAANDLEFDRELEDLYGPQVALVTPGMSLGEASLRQNTRRTATVVPREDCQFVVISKITYLQSIRKLKQTGKEQQAEWSGFLKSVELFSLWTKLSLLRLAYYLEEKKFKRNQVLFKQGEPADCVYIIMSGECALTQSVLVCSPAKGAAAAAEQLDDVDSGGDSHDDGDDDGADGEGDDGGDGGGDDNDNDRDGGGGGGGGRVTLPMRQRRNEAFVRVVSAQCEELPPGERLLHVELALLGTREFCGLEVLSRGPRSLSMRAVSDEVTVLMLKKRHFFTGQLPKHTLAKMRSLRKERQRLYARRVHEFIAFAARNVIKTPITHFRAMSGAGGGASNANKLLMTPGSPGGVPGRGRSSSSPSAPQQSPSPLSPDSPSKQRKLTLDVTPGSTPGHSRHSSSASASSQQSPFFASPPVPPGHTLSPLHAFEVRNTAASASAAPPLHAPRMSSERAREKMRVLIQSASDDVFLGDRDNDVKLSYESRPLAVPSTGLHTSFGRRARPSLYQFDEDEDDEEEEEEEEEEEHDEEEEDGYGDKGGEEERMEDEKDERDDRGGDGEAHKARKAGTAVIGHVRSTQEAAERIRRMLDDAGMGKAKPRPPLLGEVDAPSALGHRAVSPPPTTTVRVDKPPPSSERASVFRVRKRPYEAPRVFVDTLATPPEKKRLDHSTSSLEYSPEQKEEERARRRREERDLARATASLARLQKRRAMQHNERASKVLLRRSQSAAVLGMKLSGRLQQRGRGQYGWEGKEGAHEDDDDDKDGGADAGEDSEAEEKARDDRLSRTNVIRSLQRSASFGKLIKRVFSTHGRSMMALPDIDGKDRRKKAKKKVATALRKAKGTTTTTTTRKKKKKKKKKKTR